MDPSTAMAQSMLSSTVTSRGCSGSSLRIWVFCFLTVWNVSLLHSVIVLLPHSIPLLSTPLRYTPLLSSPFLSSPLFFRFQFASIHSPFTSGHFAQCLEKFTQLLALDKRSGEWRIAVLCSGV